MRATLTWVVLNRIGEVVVTIEHPLLFEILLWNGEVVSGVG